MTPICQPRQPLGDDLKQIAKDLAGLREDLKGLTGDVKKLGGHQVENMQDTADGGPRTRSPVPCAAIRSPPSASRSAPAFSTAF